MAYLLKNYVLTNHILFSNIYKNLNIPNLLNLYNIDMFKSSVAEYFRIKMNRDDWILISILDLSEDFTLEFAENISWNYRLNYYNVSDKVIIDHSELFDFKYLVKFKRLAPRILREFGDLVDWREASKTQIIPEDIITERESDVNWDFIGIFQNLSENFIIKNLNRLELSSIFMYQVVSEDFITKYMTENIIEVILIFQTLSEDFMRQHVNFNNFLNVIIILEFQSISEEFILEMGLLDKYKTEIILKYKKGLSIDFIINYINLGSDNIVRLLLTHQKLTEEFILNYISMTDENKELIVQFQDVSAEFKSKYIKRDIKKQMSIRDSIKKTNGESLYSPLIHCSNISENNIKEMINEKNILNMIRNVYLNEDHVYKYVPNMHISYKFPVTKYNVSEDFIKRQVNDILYHKCITPSSRYDRNELVNEVLLSKYGNDLKLYTLNLIKEKEILKDVLLQKNIFDCHPMIQIYECINNITEHLISIDYFTIYEFIRECDIIITNIRNINCISLRNKINEKMKDCGKISFDDKYHRIVNALSLKKIMLEAVKSY